MRNINDKRAFLIGLFLLFATGAHGQLQPPSGLRVIGSLCCTVNGNCPGRAVSDVAVTLNCTNVLGVSTTLTDERGNFSIIIPAVERAIAMGALLDNCVVTVSLPVPPPTCALLANNAGFLASTIRGLPILNTAAGLLQVAATNGFSIVTVP